ncbi:N-acetyldiaminopimelate deacetylase [Flavobacterium succinicans]|uniref:N-acetyldiaminopimelate deacetylase n=1 Tax=Flavobacterium succinicans TaxID=29536 RepID=A0A1I4Z1V0_9FLAO|nr:M20 family metallopeptidase [Flavobacterium succinicans]SFN44137.1 N-acetyldiaminopimelate deacetylase [Flavobacterium succinicans]
MKNLLLALFLVCCNLFFSISFCQTKVQLVEASDYCFNIYKQIHQNPELGKNEIKTSALIKEELKKMGYGTLIEIPILPTCVIAELDTKKPGPVIAFRAELDAKKGKEETGLPYASKLNLSHSCGHDAHASILLATAKLLMSVKGNLKGKIYFIFQPAEEIAGGADDIVNSGKLEELGIKNIFALHSAPNLTVGKLSISPGYTMAGSNYFSIVVEAKESHAAEPFRGDNMPIKLSQLIPNITAIPATKMSTTSRPCVISVTYIGMGDTLVKNLNTIPGRAVIKGTIRSYEDIKKRFDNQPSIEELIKTEISAVFSEVNNSDKIFSKGAPATINDETLYYTIITKLTKIYSGKIVPSERYMFSEDFSYYTEKIPCLYFGWGITKDDFGVADVHTTKFSIHPDAFIYGIELFADIATIQ